MALRQALVALTTLMTLTCYCQGQGQLRSVDMTLAPETSGAAVVDAVVDKIHAQ